MDAGKRKRKEDGDNAGKRMITEKGGGVDGEEAVDDEEVEEFFAILRRLRGALKGEFPAAGGRSIGKRKLSQCLEMDVSGDHRRSSKDVDCRGKSLKEEEEEEEEEQPGGRDFDLNLEPDSQST